MKKLFIMFGLIFLVGCPRPAPISPTPIVTVDTLGKSIISITSTSISGDLMIDFTTIWYYQITPDVTLKVTSEVRRRLDRYTKSNYNEFVLLFTDEIEQNNEDWVTFDCDNVPEKIINPNLIDKTKEACKIIHSMATNFWIAHSDPTEFTDTQGRIWQTQE